MVPMQDHKPKEALLHEPKNAFVDFQGLMHFRFMVPMHAQKRMEALHEPRAKAGASSTHSKRCRAVAERLGLREAFGVRPACRRFPRFMVPMQAQERKEAFPERPPGPAGKLADVGRLDRRPCESNSRVDYSQRIPLLWNELIRTPTEVHLGIREAPLR